RQQILVGRIIVVGSGSSRRVGKGADKPGGVIAQREGLAAGVREFRQQTAGVAGGDAVAVCIPDVVEAPIGIVGRDLAVLVGQGVAAIGRFGQGGVVTGLAEKAAA